MNVFEQMEAIARNALTDQKSSSGFRKIFDGSLTLSEYKSILKQTYFYTRETPQIGAQLTGRLKGTRRDAIRDLLTHALSEVGHHELARRDLERCGENVEMLPYELPLPSTAAFMSYPFYVINNRNPVGLLGIMFFMEYLPTSAGPGLMDRLSKAGVPKDATSFLAEHAVTDISHLKLMERNFEHLILCESDSDAVAYNIVVTAKLYANLLEEAVSAAESSNHTWVDSEELLNAGPEIQSSSVRRLVSI
jgi:3-oxoacyl-[acyl-carrier-protein] synthase-3